MYPIRQKEFTLIAETLKKEWDDLDLMLLREMGEDLLEFLSIGRPIIGGEMHPNQEDLGLTPVTGFDQGLKVTAD